MAKNEHTLKLEHHVFEPQRHSGLPDIVMLHGICAGAWVFPKAFLEPLLDQGYRIHTLSYRGHGESEGRGRIHDWRLSDYVSDVVSILNALSEPAIVVGHSLGSAIAQVLIRDACPLAAVVLLSPVPPKACRQSRYGCSGLIQSRINSSRLHSRLASIRCQTV